MSENRRGRRTNTTLGFLLVVLGVLFLLVNVFSLGRFIARFSWPFFVIAPGLALFVLMTVLGKSSGWLAVPASVITATGLLLFYANLFNHWESWAYTWTLIFAAAGFGILISHYWSGRPRSARFGVLVVQASLVAFVGFGLFFEVLIFTRRSVLGGLLWPGVLILLGAYLLLRGPVGRSVSRGAEPRKVRSKPKGELEFEPLKTDADEPATSVSVEAEGPKAR